MFLKMRETTLFIRILFYSKSTLLDSSLCNIKSILHHSLVYYKAKMQGGKRGSEEV